MKDERLKMRDERCKMEDVRWDERLEVRYKRFYNPYICATKRCRPSLF